CSGALPRRRHRRLPAPGRFCVISGGALEALFLPGARDDALPFAEDETRAGLALSIPQRRDLLLQRLVLRAQRGVVALGELSEQLTPTLGQALDLRPDLRQSGHAPYNDGARSTIPSARGRRSTPRRRRARRPPPRAPRRRARCPLRRNPARRA